MTEDKEKEKKKKEKNSLEDKLKECEKEREEYLNGWKRAKADFINYRKEEEDRFQSLLRSHKEVIVEEILTVLDSFELGLVMTKGEKMEKKGVELIKNQLEDALRKSGVEKIRISVGDEFNPEEHEAVEEVGSEKPEGEIIEVVERGYLINDKVLRPAKVKVSKGQS